MKLTHKLRKSMSTGIFAAILFSISSIYATSPEILHQTQNAQTITKGATYITDSRLTSKGWQDLHILKVDLEDSNIQVRPIESAKIGEKQTVLSLVEAAGAVAGVNADFFDMGKQNAPGFGLVVEDGTIKHAYNDKIIGLGASKDMGTMLIGTDKSLMLGYFSVDLTLQDPMTGVILATISSVNKPTGNLGTPAYLDRKYGPTTIPLESADKKLYKVVVENNIITKTERLGISATAVSLALNNRPGVSDETRRRVQELVSKSALDSVRGMTPVTCTIVFVVYKKHGLIIDDKPFFSRLVESVQQQAMAESLSVTLASYLPGQRLDDHISYVRGLRPDGIILEATELDREGLDRYLGLGIPLVLVDGAFDLVDVDAVVLDNEMAAFRAVDYAASMGHRDIGILRSETVITNFVRTLDGFHRGVRSHGLEDSNHPVVMLPCRTETAYEGMRRFLADPPAGFRMPTCFIADLDYIAAGAMRALQEEGYRVPDDVSIIGYDDVALAALTTPALTTTHVNRDDIGRLAVDALVRRMAAPENPTYITTQASSHLVVRGSVRRLP